ncbi:ADP-ribosylglycohydrolase family protein [Pseudonocardia sp.]|uniref:ADP-ribosylglycohydrolase family protein n=1 Tax=Pseudonocardia sp. TaxID=60912 RepID=UPI003D0EE75D
MSARLRSRTLDRAAGVLLGGAAGDALGVAYEYGSRALPGPGERPQMLGGGLGGFAPGEWSDDTAMACAVAEVAAGGADLRSEAALDRVAAGFLRWYASGPTDIGVQTRRVLGAAGTGAAAMRAVAADLHARTGRTAGNGSLMRTGPVALAHLGDTAAIVDAARAVSALTHHDPQAGDACVLWSLAIDRAVRTGELDLRAGLGHVDPTWVAWIDEAEAAEPGAFAERNGWVVAALQGAWSAAVRAAGFVDGVERAVVEGGDTDTVAAIAGALLGAAYGGSAVPARWRRMLAGWPGLRAADLTRLAVLAARGGRTDPEGWPLAATIPSYRGAWTGTVAHPDDPGVLLGAVGSRRPGVADAIVSLCRLGAAQTTLDGIAARDTVEVWLVDADDANLDVPGVLADAASAVADLRREGRTVLLHCVHAQSRTPVVAAAYGALVTGDAPAAALARVVAVLPSARPRVSLVAGLDAALDRLRSQPGQRVGHD